MAKKEEKQLNVLRFIYETSHRNGFPPTIREIGDGLGMTSPSTVHGYLTRLQDKGYLFRDPDKPRALEITASGLNAMGIQQNPTIPYLDGPWSKFNPETAHRSPLPDNLIRYAGKLFLMRMTGDNMQKIGIFDGDDLYISQQNDAENGEIVAYIGQDQKVKIARFFRERAQYRFQPENNQYHPEIMFELTIIGRVVSLFRNSIY
ncbi:repressor LexA [Weissella diestrammenae]|uniref:Repressor LexA n=1 Tax=Weissella diestrammenae TaxID=1162633 RepID=A0A7G9T5U1_9LACO|nr:transcriptional repressor LexA [Weissella diestrammenae]MCM0582296.1 repressor LexA [Weissella diestrammenae]QNN75466.1 repressor LexA [Weissella diestrammenae]